MVNCNSCRTLQHHVPLKLEDNMIKKTGKYVETEKQEHSLTSICSAPSFSMRGPGMHLIIDSKSGPRSSAKLSGESPAFPWIPLAYIAWKSHCK